MAKPHRLARTWSILTWKRWAWATGVAILVSVVVPLQTFDVSSYWAVRKVMFHMPWYILFSYLFLFAIAFVEADDRPGPIMWRYAGAALVVGLFCIWAAWSLASLIQRAPQFVTLGRVLPRLKGIDPETNHRFLAALSPGLDAAFYGCLGTLIYARLRNSRRAALALTQAEFGRSEANRNLLASQLAATNAEIDPVAVIERLEAIGRMYEKDPGAADAQLDELIAFLRGAIPRLRSEVVLEPT